MRRLALNLANLGYPVLRFDYRGTGDSAGDLNGVTADNWVEDVGHAIQEVMDMAVVPKVTLVGLRLGALVAAKAASQHKQVSRLVFWDPITDGAEYVASIRSDILLAQSQGSRSRILEADGSLHFNGFAMPPAFQETLSDWRLNEIIPSIPGSIAQIVSHESASFAALKEQLSQQEDFYYKLAPAPHDWNYVDHVGGILWPKPVIDAIEHYFSKPMLR
nr:alpha/beta fold hydrolase [Marinobacter sp. es.042]